MSDVEVMPELKEIVGALLFVAKTPITAGDMVRVMRQVAETWGGATKNFAKVSEDDVRAAMDQIRADLAEVIEDEPIDRAILDMLAPWDCLEAVAGVLEPGGILCCYVATTTQMGRVMDTLRADGGFTEPTASEVMVRDWHAEGLAIRPGHATTAHTGFLVMTRRMAPGVIAPLRKRRPAPGAYGPDYVGPIPRNVRPEHLEANRTRASELG